MIMVMKSWCYLAQVRVNKQITWKNQCVQYVILVKGFLGVG